MLVYRQPHWYCEIQQSEKRRWSDVVIDILEFSSMDVPTTVQSEIVRNGLSKKRTGTIVGDRLYV